MITEVVLGFLILTPFVLLAMLLTRNPKTRERMLTKAIRQIRQPSLTETRLGAVLLFAFWYAVMFLFMEIGIHM